MNIVASLILNLHLTAYFSGIIRNQTVWSLDQAAILASVILIHTVLRNLTDQHLTA